MTPLGCNQSHTSVSCSSLFMPVSSGRNAIRPDAGQCPLVLRRPQSCVITFQDRDAACRPMLTLNAHSRYPASSLHSSLTRMHTPSTLTLAFFFLLALVPSTLAAFGLTTAGSLLTCDTGGGLVFKIHTATGDSACSPLACCPRCWQRRLTAVPTLFPCRPWHALAPPRLPSDQSALSFTTMSSIKTRSVLPVVVTIAAFMTITACANRDRSARRQRRFSHIASGFGTATVTSRIVGTTYAVITVTSRALGPEIIQTYVARSGTPTIFMTTCQSRLLSSC